jgi:hypothetical protein
MITSGLEPGIKNISNKNPQMTKLFWGVFATFISIGLLLLLILVTQ